MVNLWYSRITLLKVNVLANVPARYYDTVADKLAENGYDANGNKIVPVAE